MADTPIINGHAYGWASVAMSIEGVETKGFTEITYSPSMEPGKVRAEGTRVYATTAGEADGEGSFTMLKKHASELIKAMGDGFMRKQFSMTINYSEEGEGGIITDELFGIRITKVEDAPKVGTEGATTKFDIHIMRMTLNGVDPHGTEEQA